MKKSNISILVLLFVLPLSIYSQENYLPGSIIKANKDTIQGFIDYRNWSRNPNVISFKTTIESQETRISPIDIVAFNVKDEKYFSAIVETEISARGESFLDDNMEFILRTDTVFLQALITGAKGLYFYKDQEGKENFYISAENGFDLLLFKKFLFNDEFKNVVKESDRFRGQLKSYFLDYPSIQAEVDGTNYQKRNLISLFLKYYSGVGATVEFRKEMEKMKVKFGLLFGMTSTSVTFQSEDYKYDFLLEGDFDNSLSLSGGISIEVILPRNNQRWSIYNELLYTSYSFNNTYIFTIPGALSVETIINSELAFKFAMINNLLRFSYSQNDFKYFVNAGLTQGVVLSSINQKDESEIYSSYLEIDEALPHYPNYEVGGMLGAGLGYKAISLEVKLGSSRAMNSSDAEVPPASTQLNRMYLFLGYRF